MCAMHLQGLELPSPGVSSQHIPPPAALRGDLFSHSVSLGRGFKSVTLTSREGREAVWDVKA